MLAFRPRRPHAYPLLTQAPRGPVQFAVYFVATALWCLRTCSRLLKRAWWRVIATRRAMATRIVIVAVTLAVIVLLPHAARRATLAEYMPHSAGSESVRASWYNRPVVDPNAKPEAAVDQDEAIREEIRA